MSESITLLGTTQQLPLSSRRMLSVVGALVWAFLFVQGALHYQGQLYVYAAFSVVFLGLFLSGVHRPPSFGYMYFTIFLWLGFWLKLVLHLWLKYEYIEPIGFFISSGPAWDHVLTISMSGAFGVLIARYICSFLHAGSAAVALTVPAWYLPRRRLLWTVLLVGTVVLGVLNVVLGIQLIGLVPRTILHWPLNALISWLLNLGLGTAVVTLAWWDIASRKNVTFPMYGILFEALFSGVSILSRGTFLYHFIPGVIAAFKKRKRLAGLTLSRVAIYFAIAGGVFILSISVVTALRYALYQSEEEVAAAGPNNGAFHEFSKLVGGRVYGPMLTLAADRWIGLEGVMSVSSYPKRSMELLSQGLSEQRRDGKVTMYQSICDSIYLKSNQAKWSFASLPGAMAFWYYADSLLIVTAGMLLLTSLLIVAERLVWVGTRNPFMASLYGFAFANVFAQFGITPRADIPYFIMLAGGVVLVCVVQSRWFAFVVAKAGWR